MVDDVVGVRVCMSCLAAKDESVTSVVVVVESGVWPRKIRVW